jgi:dihydrofolate reductase
VVLTRQPGWQAAEAIVAGSLEAALAAAEGGEVWVIGGASVYREALPFAGRVVITDVDAAYAGDTFAPALGADWQETTREPAAGWHTSSGGLRYRVTTYERASRRVPAIPS